MRHVTVKQVAGVLQSGIGASASKARQPVPQPPGYTNEHSDPPLREKINHMELRLSII